MEFGILFTSHRPGAPGWKGFWASGPSAARITRPATPPLWVVAPSRAPAR